MNAFHFFLAGATLLSSFVFADSESIILDGHSLRPQSFTELSESISAGDIVILTEIHDSQLHHENQISMIRALQSRGLTVNVGMEFFSWPDQSFVDQFTAGTLTESDFLSAIKWGGQPFDDYRWQTLLPRLKNGSTIAINAPRALTNKVAKLGLAQLSTEEIALLPTQFALGNDLYRERFTEVMKPHVPPEKIVNYFAAQSIWDDTMADRACRFEKNHADQVLLIIVGDFHGIYGGGLPDRLRARGCDQLKVISQMLRPDLKGVEKDEEVIVDPKHGPRADVVWISKDKERSPRSLLIPIQLLNE